jgi:hypothetical protein
MKLQSRCVARLHSLAISKDDLNAWIGCFLVDLGRGTGDVHGGTPGVDHGRKISEIRLRGEGTNARASESTVFTTVFV